MEKYKYKILLSELAALLDQKNDEIMFKNAEIKQLKEKLKAAENSVKHDGKPQIEKRNKE